MLEDTNSLDGAQLLSVPVFCLDNKHKRARIYRLSKPLGHTSPVKRICVFQHSVMTNFNCACPTIQRGRGSGFLSEGSYWLTACMSEQRRFWRACAAWTFAARIGDKYQIRLTRSIRSLTHILCKRNCWKRNIPCRQISGDELFISRHSSTSSKTFIMVTSVKLSDHFWQGAKEVLYSLHISKEHELGGGAWKQNKINTFYMFVFWWL